MRYFIRADRLTWMELGEIFYKSRQAHMDTRSLVAIANTEIDLASFRCRKFTISVLKQ